MTTFKIIAFFLAWLILWLPIAIPLAIELKWQPSQPLTPQQKLPLLASLYLLVPLLIWGVIYLENTTLNDYGLVANSRFLGTIGLGWLLAVIGLVISFTLQRLFGWITWSKLEFSVTETEINEVTKKIGLSVLLTTFFLGLWVSITEEVIFRGWLTNELGQDYSIIIAGSIASFIFAISHLLWEGRSNLVQIPGLWLMGMVLTYARFVNDGNLGIAIGLHAGWIWGIATLDTTQIINFTNKAPTWMTGKPGQPLASLIGILLLLATGIVLKFVVN